MGLKQSSIYTVTELTAMIRGNLEADPRFTDCYVSGEISNFKRHSSNHLYFTLKDEKSRIRAVMFAGRARFLQFLPEDGMRVVLRGTISVFDRDGQYQLYVEDMQPDGVGALYVAFTQLRDRLEAEGLFGANRKRELPAYPRRIGVVTSVTGAVLRDIYSTLKRRYPLASIVVAPALVQGAEAAASIVRAVDSLIRFSKLVKPIDVLIVGRGGGSLEELWPFNEEAVARVISTCPIPVVSAVGHETDVTICDFVSDVRAATPTAAAELVAPHIDVLNARLRQMEERAKSALRWRVTDQRQRLLHLSRTSVLTQPTRFLNIHRQNVDFLQGQVNQLVGKPVRNARRRLSQAAERLYRVDVPSRLVKSRSQIDLWAQRAQQQVQAGLTSKQGRWERLAVTLEALNPLTVLRRGYSVVYKLEQDELVTSTEQVGVGERLRIRFADGTLVVRSEGGDLVGGQQSRLDI